MMCCELFFAGMCQSCCLWLLARVGRSSRKQEFKYSTDDVSAVLEEQCLRGQAVGSERETERIREEGLQSLQSLL